MKQKRGKWQLEIDFFTVQHIPCTFLPWITISKLQSVIRSGQQNNGHSTNRYDVQVKLKQNSTKKQNAKIARTKISIVWFRYPIHELWLKTSFVVVFNRSPTCILYLCFLTFYRWNLFCTYVMNYKIIYTIYLYNYINKLYRYGASANLIINS